MSASSQFQQHYASLHDDELMHLALSDGLVPEASAALRQELQRRGIHDIAAYQASVEQEEREQESVRLSNISKNHQYEKKFSRIFYAIALLTFAYGLYQIWIPATERNEGEIGLIAGPAIFIFIWLRSKAKKIWTEQIIFRKPPR